MDNPKMIKIECLGLERASHTHKHDGEALEGWVMGTAVRALIN